MTDLTHLLLALRAQIVDSEGPIKIGPYTVDQRDDGAWWAMRDAAALAISPTRLGAVTTLLVDLLLVSDGRGGPCEACNEQPSIEGHNICLPCELTP